MIANSQYTFSQRIFYILIGAGIILNATGLFNQILEPDSALYAGIARQMALSNDWINLYGDGHDWLDKPHFPFWMAAIGFKIFGVSAFTYKLVSFLFWLAGARFSYLLARLLFNTTTAQIAAVIYISALHVIIANFDVRAEGYLTCCSIAAIYYICRAADSKKIIYIVLAALFTASAIMTKGIFILCTIAGGHVLYWIINKNWKEFINYKWWLLLLLTFVFILPELYCLYMQFDKHPEKIVFGKTNVSGIRFFFWDSQFGRFFNTGPIKGNGDKTFFLHTTLWAFLPWAILLYLGVIQLIRRKLPMQKIHWIIYGGAVITFLLFSLSSFQLPHYILIVFPQFAILTAAFVLHLANKQKAINNILVFHSALIIILVIALSALVYVCQFRATVVCIMLLLCAAILSFVLYRKKNVENILIKGTIFTFILAVFLNLYFYPNILKYQSGMMAAAWLKTNNMNQPVTMYKTFSYSLEFYSPNKIQRAMDDTTLRQYISSQPTLIYSTAEDIASLAGNHVKLDSIQAFDFFPVSRLDMKFLNHKTRKTTLKRIVLTKIATE